MTTPRRILIGLMLALAAWHGAALAAFDQEHKTWSELLRKHVVVHEGGKSSRVNYAGFAQDRTRLKAYLGDLSAVSDGDFKSWSKPQPVSYTHLTLPTNREV